MLFSLWLCGFCCLTSQLFVWHELHTSHVTDKMWRNQHCNAILTRSCTINGTPHSTSISDQLVHKVAHVKDNLLWTKNNKCCNKRCAVHTCVLLSWSRAWVLVLCAHKKTCELQFVLLARLPQHTSWIDVVGHCEGWAASTCNTLICL